MVMTDSFDRCEIHNMHYPTGAKCPKCFLGEQNIDFILKGSADRADLIKQLTANNCTVNPCQHRSPPAIGGDSYYKEQHTKLMNLLLDVMNNGFEDMDDLQNYIRDYIL